MYSLCKRILSKTVESIKVKDLFFSTKFKIIVILLAILGGVLSSDLMAQDSLRTLDPMSVKNIFTTKPEVILIPEYEMSGENTVHLKMSYGAYKVLNKSSWPGRVVDKRPKQVDIVMTLHPSDTSAWREDFYDLIKNRVVALEDLDSAFLIDKFIKWNIYLQDKSSSYNTAKNQFHGIVVHYKPLPKETQQKHYSALLFKWDERRQVKIAGNKLNKIVDRNKGKWKDMLVITDCSGSMIPHGTEVVLWHLLRHERKNISQFVFFNDGNATPFKEIGNAGGVYLYQSKQPEKVVKAVRHFTDKGLPYNIDIPENDVEAIIKGSEMVEKFDDIILIADNGSGIRDISIANEIKKPVRIVLCGVINNQIHPDYFKLAYETNGSIHTIEEDINEFMKTKHGQIIAINDVKYKVEEDELVQVSKKGK